MRSRKIQKQACSYRCLRHPCAHVSLHFSQKDILHPMHGFAKTPKMPRRYCTVQLPRCCQPLLAVLPRAYIHTCLAPANDGVNVIGMESVTLLPLDTTVVAPRLMLHWLFCNVPAVPGVPVSQAVPASSISRRRLL